MLKQSTVNVIAFQHFFRHPITVSEKQHQIINVECQNFDVKIQHQSILTFFNAFFDVEISI